MVYLGASAATCPNWAVEAKDKDIHSWGSSKTPVLQGEAKYQGIRTDVFPKDFNIKAFQMLLAWALLIFVLHSAAKATPVYNGAWEVKEEIHFPFFNEDGVRKYVIFCHPGQKRVWFNAWVKPYLQVESLMKDVPPADLVSYSGNSMTDVSREIYAMPDFKRSSSSALPAREYLFSPFNYRCIGFVSSESFAVYFQVKNPEWKYIGVVICGVALFFYAPSLSRKALFHFALGFTACMLSITVTTLASCFIAAIIIIYYLSQAVEGNWIARGLNALFSDPENLVISEAVNNKLMEVFSYFLLFAALASFVITYRFLSISDPRTLNLICWSLQALGLRMVYHITQIEEASAAITLVLTIYICRPDLGFLKTAYQRYFIPKKVHLLTEEEYYCEGQEETRRALEDLREYCHSPQCNKWHTLSRLSAPSRLIQFVDDGSHLSDAEVEEHSLFLEANCFPQQTHHTS